MHVLFFEKQKQKQNKKQNKKKTCEGATGQGTDNALCVKNNFFHWCNDVERSKENGSWIYFSQLKKNRELEIKMILTKILR